MHVVLREAAERDIEGGFNQHLTVASAEVATAFVLAVDTALSISWGI
jgi:hypothetical protein